MRRLDPDAVVLDVSDGWAVHTLEGPDAREAFSRLSELDLPDAGFVQGEAARIGIRVLVEGDRLDLLVPSALAAHLHERIEADCAELVR